MGLHKLMANPDPYAPACLIDAVKDTLRRVTHLINVGSRWFGWRLALWCGPIHGLSSDGARWPVGLHRSINTTEVLKGPVCSFF